MAWQGKECNDHGMAWKGMTWLGKERDIMAWHGMETQGKARYGMAWQGMQTFSPTL
jgi:hypothetical protein